ncbi:MAG: NAD(P)/FAD-dependent oxidoreductase, partial [Actinobacteria bacterium]|nr:NAD(P)/FAD-dependent oxidoreductase [Actinomycetota bacterium]
MSKLKVVVIGTGVGGAGAAALMQHRGCDVTILDRNPYIGGRCHSFEKNGFIVDSGIHMFSRGRSGPLAEINSIVGGDLRWLTPRTQITFVIGGKYRLPYCQPIYDPEMAMKLAYIAGMSTIKSMGGRSTASGRKSLMNNSLFRIMKRDGGIIGLVKEMINLVSINEIYLSELDDVTVREFLLGFTDNLMIHQVVAYAAMILTSTPYTVCSAGEVLWSMMKQVYASSFGVPEGASRAIPVAYIEAMQRAGGQLHLSTPVDKIVVNDGEVTGVKTKEGEEIPADVVISNAGILLTCEMVGEKNLPADYYKRAHELKTSYSHITRKYALSKKVADIGSNGVFNVPDMDPETMFDYTDNGGVPEDAYMFTSIPTEVDRNLAEPGKQLIIMGMPGPRSGDKSTAEHCNRIL